VDRLERIGLAVYTVREEAERDFDATLAALASIGYRELDMYIYASGREARETRAAMDRAGLLCPSARVRTASLYRGWDRFLEAAAALGARHITLASIPDDERVTLRDWHELADLFNRAGEAASRAGLTLCYHNHDFEFVPVEGTVPFELMLAETDPRLLRIQMDVYWLTRGGRDPVAELRRLGERVASLHLKDMDATPARGITTVGRGTIDFPAVLRAATDAGVRHYFVEEDDPPRPVLDAVRAAYEHLHRLEF
jgi:sugar phosphate isomerase/epimerase